MPKDESRHDEKPAEGKPAALPAALPKESATNVGGEPPKPPEDVKAPPAPPDKPPFILKASAIARATDSDVFVYAGRIDRPFDDAVIDECSSRKRRPNILFFITTYGGDADAAYRIARGLRRKYKKITVIIPGYCKSAGTLLVLGADELVLFDHAELGPLDVQLFKEDEFGQYSSGLAPTQACQFLDAQVREALKTMVVDLKFDLALTTKTATEVGSKVISHLYGGIYAQFDPLKLGEIQRAQAVGFQYGKRLIEQSRITNVNSLHRLLSSYPSHEFVIDLEEARELFLGKVREPTDDERELEALFHEEVRAPPHDKKAKPITLFISEEG